MLARSGASLWLQVHMMCINVHGQLEKERALWLSHVPSRVDTEQPLSSGTAAKPPVGYGATPNAVLHPTIIAEMFS